MNLNGWQRLWVIIAGLWVVALGSFWINELFDVNKDLSKARYRLATDISVWEKHGCLLSDSPKIYGLDFSGVDLEIDAQQLKTSRAKKNGLIKDCNSIYTTRRSPKTGKILRTFTISPVFIVRHYGDTPNDYIQDALSRYSKEKDPIKAEQFEHIYWKTNYAVDKQLDRRKEVIGLGLAFTLLPPISIYLTGLAFVWIKKGFKGGQS